MKKLYLVDVSSMFFRAFYAVRALTSPQGLPVNAIYGFLSMLIKLLKEEKPEYLVFCYDRKEPSFRKDLYEDYKANRSEMPEELAQQIPYIKKLADLLGVPSLEVPGFEADDLIGTLSQIGTKAGCQVLIVSGDKDFGQLVSPQVQIYDTMKGVRYDPAGVKEKWGIRPDQVIDYLALVGDSSDHIPGVKGIGPKGALKLLEQFKNLEEIYERLPEVENKSVREKLEASKELAFLSKRLVTIVTDVELPSDLEHYHLRPFRREELRALLKELNFKTFEKNLLGEEGAENGSGLPVAGPTPASTVATGPSPVSEPLPATSSAMEAPLTPETLAPLLDDLEEVGVLSEARGVTLVLNQKLYPLEGDLTLFGPVLQKKTLRWTGFDLKSAWEKLHVLQATAAWDTMLAAYVVEAGDSSDLAALFKKHLDLSLPELASPTEWWQAELHLKQKLETLLQERQGEKILHDLELPLIPILRRMEAKGIRLDLELLKKQSQELAQDLASLEKDVHSLAGESFNVGSPKQLGQILFEKLGLEATKKTKTGYSTDNEVLEKMAHPIAAKVLQWRELSKLKSTYVDALPVLADAEGRVHTKFNQALTATGRLSSTHPNLQNIPIRTPRGQQVRQAFIAADGQSLMSVDYSQIELRILAHISEDPGLCRAFAEGLDIHAATAAEVFGVSLSAVTAEQRRAAKAVNFGIAYGQGAYGLAENLGIPRGEAQGIIKRYFEKFKGVESYIEETTKSAYEKGYVETLAGRRRYLPELQQKNPMVRKFGERAAINAPIQGTASDLVKLAMIRLAQQLDLALLLQVHDELIFEGEETELKAHLPQVKSIMENVMSLKVPLKVNAAIGRNWDEAH